MEDGIGDTAMSALAIGSDVIQPPKFSNPKVALASHFSSRNSLLCELPNIVTRQEADILVNSLDKGLFGKEWTLEGYDRRHRVQRYFHTNHLDVTTSGDSCHDTTIASWEGAFGWIFDRIQSRMSETKPFENIIPHRPIEVVVTEHTPSSYRSVVNTYEQYQMCPCQSWCNHNTNTHCCCYIAQLTLINTAIQYMEKPKHRDLECWDLATPLECHSSDITMRENGAIVKMGESLWEWRCRISNVLQKETTATTILCELPSYSEDEYAGANIVSSSDHTTEESFDNFASEKKKSNGWTRTKKLKAINKRCIIVTFRGIQLSLGSTLTQSDESDQKSSLVIDNLQQSQHCGLSNRPLSELLTIIVTTSPIRSNPSTEMLEQTFETFRFAGEEFAYECKKIIICDGCRVFEQDEVHVNDSIVDSSPPKITRKYANGKQNLRNGIATVDQWKNYQKFKEALCNLCQAGDSCQGKKSKSPFKNAQVVQLEERHGYGFALREALYHFVDTPYVCVIQHDRNFVRTTPVKAVLNAMIADPMQRIKYVGMSMRSNLMYFDIFSGKYGKKAMEEMKDMILRPKELNIDGNIYGADGESVKHMLDPRIQKRSKVLETLKETYRGSLQYLNQADWLQSAREPSQYCGNCHQLSLTPTLFWYDNTHIVETAHYRDYIFNPKYKMVARGGFVEDKLSPIITRHIERLGLKEGHAKFGCYILDDHSGMFFTGHLDGGSYQTAHLHLEGGDAEGVQYI